MIDAGTNKSGKALSQRFREEGIGRIDLLIITHFDKDHVGGADKILDAASVGEVLPGSMRPGSPLPLTRWSRDWEMADVIL